MSDTVHHDSAQLEPDGVRRLREGRHGEVGVAHEIGDRHGADQVLFAPGGRVEARQAARWLSLAANKGQHQAQALLGRMLFKGEQMPRQAARGLMWLTLARESASPQEAWIADLYDSAVRQATADERSLALVYLERWVNGRRD